MMGTLHEDLCRLVIMSIGDLFRMKNVLDKSCRENQNMFYLQYFFPKMMPFKIMWAKKAQNAWLRFHYNNGYANALQCHVVNE
jgi:hypothetical protein